MGIYKTKVALNLNVVFNNTIDSLSLSLPTYYIYVYIYVIYSHTGRLPTDSLTRHRRISKTSHNGPLKILTEKALICGLQSYPNLQTEFQENRAKSVIKTAYLDQCFSTFVRQRPGKFFFNKTRTRYQQIYSSVPFQFFF